MRSPPMRSAASVCCAMAFTLARSRRAALNPSRNSAASFRSSALVRSRNRSERKAAATDLSRAAGSEPSFSITDSHASS